jgi:hypothetical protein
MLADMYTGSWARGKIKDNRENETQLKKVREKRTKPRIRNK